MKEVEVAFCKASPCEPFTWSTDDGSGLLHAVGGCEHGAVLCVERQLFSYLWLQICVLRVTSDVQDVLWCGSLRGRKTPKSNYS